MISFDTNILVYAADDSAGERHIRAADLIARSVRRGNCIQTLQSLGDLQDGRVLDGVRFVDPFVARSAAYIDQIPPPE